MCAVSKIDLEVLSAKTLQSILIEISNADGLYETQ